MGTKNGVTKSKYLADTSVDASDEQATEGSIHLEFASVESDGPDTYCSDESVSKKPEIYRSLQDEFLQPDNDHPFSSSTDQFSTPKLNQRFSYERVTGITSIRIYDASPTETIEGGKIFREGDFDGQLASLTLPNTSADEAASQGDATSADEIIRLESVLKRWQSAVDECENERVVSPSMVISEDFVPRPPSPKPEEPSYPTFTEITFLEAAEACLGVSIQPSHYSASAVLRHTTKASLACCCVTAPANDSRSATDRALVFAIADWRYNENLAVHWQTLATIYSKLTGELNTVYRYGPHWEKIGFQGSDPVTDLRSAGYLGLLHLLFLSTQATPLAQHCYNLSTQRRSQFPLAITGLNLTKMVMGAIRSGRLKVEKNRSNPVSAGGVPVASDRFLTASCKLYVALWHHFATIWSSRHCTIENSHEVLSKMEKMAQRNSNQLLKKSTSYLNGSYSLTKQNTSFAPYNSATERSKSPLSLSNRTYNGGFQETTDKTQNKSPENIEYTDISAF